MASEVKLDLGFFIKEFSFSVMALSAICVGSYAAVKYIKSLKEKGEAPELPPLSIKNAFVLPLLTALCLIFQYLCVKFDKIKEEENKLDSTTEPSDPMVDYFIIVTVLAIPCSQLIRPLISFLLSPVLCDIQYQLCFKKRKGEEEKYLIDKHFTTYDVISFLGCFIVGLSYALTKNWIINNIIVIVGAIFVIKYFHLNKMVTGCFLLTLFVIYDVIFVFGTDIMYTVVTSFDTPNKLMFPRDIMKEGWNDVRFSLLGSGGVVLPGVMIAFLLRFDLSLKRNSWFYFYTSIASYLVGLLICAIVAHFTQTLQPALMYLVPCSVIPPLVLAFIRGDGAELFKFGDFPGYEGQNEEKGNEDNQPDSSQLLSSSKDIPDKKKDD